jgi:hypothetical protein
MDINRPGDRRVVLYIGKPWGDPDYDFLLDEFCHLMPSEFDRWQIIEKRLFETRETTRTYPDLPFMQLCQKFMEDRLDDKRQLGASRAWTVLRGRILRDLINETPNLNPSPGKLLITDPRTLSDEELVSLADAFGLAHPQLWSDWQRIEREGNFDNDPLRPASFAFHSYVMENCWVQSTIACGRIFLDVRGIFYRQPRTAECT